MHGVKHLINRIGPYQQTRMLSIDLAVLQPIGQAAVGSLRTFNEHLLAQRLLSLYHTNRVQRYVHSCLCSLHLASEGSTCSHCFAECAAAPSPELVFVLPGLPSLHPLSADDVASNLSKFVDLGSEMTPEAASLGLVRYLLGQERVVVLAPGGVGTRARVAELLVAITGAKHQNSKQY